MVVVHLAGLGGEAEVGDRGDGKVGFRRGEGEAVGPGAFGFPLQVEREGFILEVREAGLGGYRCSAESSRLVWVDVSSRTCSL